MTDTQHVLASRKGGFVTSSRYSGQEITAAARQGRHDSYRRRVDPNSELSEAERERRANALMHADMASMRLAKEQKSKNKAARG